MLPVDPEGVGGVCGEINRQRLLLLARLECRAVI
jgi:hypothetical protein